jgi:hypothetical protein
MPFYLNAKNLPNHFSSDTFLVVNFMHAFFLNKVKVFQIFPICFLL